MKSGDRVIIRLPPCATPAMQYQDHANGSKATVVGWSNDREWVVVVADGESPTRRRFIPPRRLELLEEDE